MCLNVGCGFFCQAEEGRDHGLRQLPPASTEGLASKMVLLPHGTGIPTHVQKPQVIGPVELLLISHALPG